MNETDTAQAFFLDNEELISEAVKNNEGVIASNGAFSTSTGARTGRSPNDRFIVDEPTTSDLIDWVQPAGIGPRRCPSTIPPVGRRAEAFIRISVALTS